MLLDPGFDLNLRPMKYPAFFEMYKNGIKNTWTVDEVDFSKDYNQLLEMPEAEKHLIKRLVAFFATGDSIVGNNLVLNLYQHINSPEARLYLSRQLFEEALHVEFYLTLLDNYIPNEEERALSFRAIENIPTIKQKAEFSFKWMDSINNLNELQTKDDRRRFLMNLICFATCIEGLFFFAAFAYVYYLRSRGLLDGLAEGTNWVFRDESCHMEFAYAVIHTASLEEPDLITPSMKEDIKKMMEDAIHCENNFSQDVLKHGLAGLSDKDMLTYLKHTADLRLEGLGISPMYNVKNPFPFMDLQNFQELTNFFEKRVSAYQKGVSGTVSFDEKF